MLDGVAGGGTARGDPELAVNRGEVKVDRARTDDELLGYLGIGQPLCHQAQYLDLTRRQASRIARGFSEGSRFGSTGQRPGGRDWSPCGEGLLWRHRKSLSQHCLEYLLTEPLTHDRDVLLIATAEDWRQRRDIICTPYLLCCAPQACRPCWFSQCCSHFSQQIQTPRDKEGVGILPLAEDCQALP